MRFVKTCLRACQRSAFVSFVISNVQEYNWKCLLEMSSRKINVKEFSSLKAVEKLNVEDRGFVYRVLWLKMQGRLQIQKTASFPGKNAP